MFQFNFTEHRPALMQAGAGPGLSLCGLQAVVGAEGIASC